MMKTKVVAHFLAWFPLGWLVYAIFMRQLGGDPQEKLLHELGLWSLIFFLLSLSMTPIKLLTKKAQWIKYRRMLGLYAAFYLFLHVMTYFFFYLGFDIAELFSEIVKRPYITVGMLAFLAVIPLVLTSTKKSQKSLGKNWKKIHQLAYWVAALGIVHFIWQSKSDLNEPLLYVLWAAALAFVRLKYKKTQRVN